MISPVHHWVEAETGLHGNLNPTTLEKWQQAKLKEVLEYTRNNSRYYRRILSDPLGFSEIPYTALADLAADPQAFLCVHPSEVARVTTLKGYGMASVNKRVFFSEPDLERSIRFFSAGMLSLTEPGWKVQILISSGSGNSLGSLLKESLRRNNIQAEVSTPASVQEAIEASKQADCIVGMPAELLYMCCVEPGFRPCSVLMAADYVADSIVRRIQASWKCEVFTHYGHTELGFGYAVDCRQHNGLHLRHADFLIELIDPETLRPVRAGETGEIVITSLQTGAMPLIRYRTGDLSCLLTHACACGCSLPRLGKILGRIENKLTVGNGSTFSIHQLDELLFADPQVRNISARLDYRENPPGLALHIDSSGNLPEGYLYEKLPDISLKISYCTIDPFKNRGKRMITILNHE